MQRRNGSLHTSHLTRQQWQRWFAQDLFLFFLSPYCSEMNRIEDQWHQLKTHEIAGQMFEDEYDERPCNYAWNESSEFQRWLPTGTF